MWPPRTSTRSEEYTWQYSTDTLYCVLFRTGVQNWFYKGVICGKRDSTVYYNAGLEESFTNPGEWPWAVVSRYPSKQF